MPRPVTLALLMPLVALALPPAATGQSCAPAWADQFPAGDINGLVHALAVVDLDGPDGGSPPALYVGGAFTVAGGMPASRVARWDGTAWSALDLGVNSTVFALAEFDDDGPGPHPPALYAAGNFTLAGDVSVARVAKWNGSAWSPVGSGTNNVVYALTVFDEDGSGPNPPALYAGGLFTTAGGSAARRVAKWNGTTWSAVGDGMDSYVKAFAAFDADGPGPDPPRLYAGGGFTLADGTAANYVAFWNGSAWQPLTTGPNENGVNNIVHDLVVFDPDADGPLTPALYLGGYFTAAGSVSAARIARWDGGAFAALGAGLGGPAWTLAVYDEDGAGPARPALAVGGYFTVAGSGLARNLARWDGSGWSEVGGGLNDGVRVLVAFDDSGGRPVPPALYAGGDFTQAGSVPSGHLARWGCPADGIPPAIVRPPSSQTVCAGQGATFSVTAVGTPPLSYQWLHDGVPLPGATGRSYAIAAAGPEHAGAYAVLVSNDYGTALSDSALLALAGPPVITQQPQSLLVCWDYPASFHVAADGPPPLACQWWRNGQPIFGATGDTLTIPAVGLADLGAYHVVVSNPCGAVASEPALLAAGDNPVITAQPEPRSACAGQVVELTVAAEGPAPLAYRWRRDGQLLPGATAATLRFDAVSPADAGAYDVIVSSPCGATVSAAAALDVGAAPEILAQPQPQDVCAGAAVTLEVVVAAPEGCDFQWRRDGQPIAGATAPSYTLDPVTPEDAGVYDVELSTTCGTLLSAAATLAVAAAPSIAEQPRVLPQSPCAGSVVVLEVTATGSGPLGYQWRRDGEPIPGATADTYIISPVAPADAGRYDVEVTGRCGTSLSDGVLLAVDSGPVVVTSPASQSVCLGGPAAFSVVADGAAPLTYQWRKDGQPIAGATAATCVLDTVTAADAGSYDVVVSGRCGSATSAAAELSVAAPPQIVTPPQDSQACAGAAVTLSVAAEGSPPLAYQWYRDGTPLAGATAALLLLDPVAAGDAGSYEVAVSNACGVERSPPAVLAVGFGPTFLQHPQSRTACLGETVTLTSAVEASDPVTYRWRKDGQELPGETAASLVVAAAAPADAGTYDVVAAAACGSAISAAAVLTVQSCLATPGVPADPQPPSGAVGVALAPLLGWAAAEGADSYEVYLGPPGAPALLGTTAATQWTASGLAYATTYHWRVVARNAAGATAGPIWAFTTRAAPVPDDTDPGTADPDPGTDHPDPGTDDPPQDGGDDPPPDDGGTDPTPDDPPAADPPADDPWEDPWPAGCGAGPCGAGTAGAVPLTLLALGGLRGRLAPRGRRAAGGRRQARLAARRPR